MTYQIVRKYQDTGHPDHDKVIKENLTREEAKDHCSYDDSRGDGWFDCFYEE